MFETAKLMGTPPDEGIPLATRAGTAIPNLQALDPDPGSKILDTHRLQRHTGWVHRKPISGLYNCYGLVWASRRTSIYDTDDSIADMIRRHDRYRMFPSSRLPKPGDIVVYRLASPERMILHIGSVTEIKTIGSTQVPWILSKWGDASSEVIHNVNDTPWSDDTYDYTFWTDRPNSDPP